MRKFIIIWACLLFSLQSFAQELIWFQNDSFAQIYLEKLSPGFEAKKLSPTHDVYKIIPAVPEESVFLNSQQNGILLFQKCHQIDFRAKSPNDPLYGFQYYLNNIYKPGKDIAAARAWDFVTGGVSPSGDTLVIAFVDDGIDTAHPDLVKSLWKFSGEIPNDSLDNDSNGYKDDEIGYNASQGNGQIISGSHGTPVSCVAGAQGNNGIGITGVCWNVKLLPVVISGVDESEVVAAYLYILNQRRLYNNSGGKKGAYIVSANSSFGVFQQKPSDFPLWCAMYDSLGKEGILSVAATVNASVRIDSYGDVPSMCASNFLVVVSSTDSNDQNCNAGFSNTFVDLSAPGCDIFTGISGGSYSYVSGTSFAAPLVTAAAALLYAAPCNAFSLIAHSYPDSAALLVKKYILSGTDPLTGAAAQTVSGGRLNLYQSLNHLVKESCWNNGIQIPASYNQIEIYPIPANKEVFFSEAIVNAQLYNSTGIPISKVQGKYLDCSFLPDGFYFIKNEQNTFKFLVIH